jgi:hypothetical protein
METTHGITAGDKVRILIGEGDSARYGMAEEMQHVRGEIGTVRCVFNDRISVSHPTFTWSYDYKPSELEKVKEEDAHVIQFKNGDRVKIVSQGAYGSNHLMDEGLNGYGEVKEAEYPGTSGRSAHILVALDNGLGNHIYDHHELQAVVVLRGAKADFAVVDDTVPEKHIQSHDELVAENESLEKQIRKLEARVERKKEFQRQNVRKIAAWQVILEK